MELDAWVGAELARPPLFLSSARKYVSGSQAKGVRYERKVHETFLSLDQLYTPGPWIRSYTNSGRSAYHQPDGLRFDFNSGKLLVLEIKFRHCLEAYRQLRRYQKVCQLLFPEWEVCAVEVVRWYEPGVAWPRGGRLEKGSYPQGQEYPSVFILRL